MIDAYVEFWKRAFDYKGVTTRRNYWLTVLVHFIVTLILSLFPFGPIIRINVTGYSAVPITLAMIYAIIAAIPGIAITVRRLHDARFSGLFVLLGLIPIGGIVVFVMTLLEARYDDNVWYQNDREHGSY